MIKIYEYHYFEPLQVQGTKKNKPRINTISMDAIMNKTSSRKKENITITSALADHSEFSINHISSVNISATIFIKQRISEIIAYSESKLIFLLLTVTPNIILESI